MKQTVRVIVFNGEEEYTPVMRADLLSLEGVQIVAEIDELTLLDQAAGQFPAEVLIAHLDPFPETVLPVVASVAQSHPHLAVFVISQSTDGQHILAAMRSGVREFLTKPVERERIAAAIEKVVDQSMGTVELGRLIPVIGTVGGCGASMLSVNLAVELTEFAQSRPVAVVDLDFRYGQLGTMFDVQPDYTIADLADTPEQLDQGVIDKVMVKHSTGVHVLARPNLFSQADQITAAHCASVLAALQQMYEYVVIDGPSRFDPGGLSVLDLSNSNLLVIQLLVTSVRNVHRMLEELREGGYNLDRFRIVCNRVGRESSHLTIEHVQDTLRRKVSHQLPDDWKTVSSAINMGMSLREYAPKSKVRASIHELAERIAHPEQEVNEEVTKGGLLNRIFS